MLMLILKLFNKEQSSQPASIEHLLYVLSYLKIFTHLIPKTTLKVSFPLTEEEIGAESS